MSQTAIQVCNLALTKLGENVIESFEDGTKPSKLCRLHYPVLRNNLLRDHVWTFSRVFTPMSPLALASEVFPWTYQYQLPSDLGRILAVTVEDYPIKYEQIGHILHSDRDTIDLRYVRNFGSIDDGFAFPDDFAEALSSLLAAELAIPLTQTQALRETFLNMYVERLRTARFNGAVERSDDPIVASSWLDAHDCGVTEIDPRLRGLSGI